MAELDNMDVTAANSLDAPAGQTASGTAAVSSPDMSLRRAPQKRKLKPGQRWDGRLQGLSVEEYREMKWNLDAAFGKTMRGGPSYTMRPNVSFGRHKSSPVFITGDPVKALDVVKPKAATFTMGRQFGGTKMVERSPGPAQYTMKSIMDSKKHPTYAKNMGAVFGTEVMGAKQEEDSPAPGNYDHMQYLNSGTCKRAGNYTIPGREAWRPRTEAPGPGVGEYEVPGIMRFGKDTPITWTCQGKTLPKEPARGSRRFVGPGPGAYDNPGTGDRKEPHTGSNYPGSREVVFGREPRGLL